MPEKLEPAYERDLTEESQMEEDKKDSNTTPNENKKPLIEEL